MVSRVWCRDNWGKGLNLEAEARSALLLRSRALVVPRSWPLVSLGLEGDAGVAKGVKHYPFDLLNCTAAGGGAGGWVPLGRTPPP